jgi:hypothetical protein
VAMWQSEKAKGSLISQGFCHSLFLARWPHCHFSLPGKVMVGWHSGLARTLVGLAREPSAGSGPGSGSGAISPDAMPKSL